MKWLLGVVACHLALLAGVPAEAREIARQVGTQPAALNLADNSAILDRPTGVDLERVRLDVGLATLRDRTGVRIAYSPSLLPEDVLVTCHCADVSLREALAQMLDGTGFRFSAVGPYIVVEPEERSTTGRPARTGSFRSMAVPAVHNGLRASWASEVLTAPIATGTITGVVTSAATLTPLSAAQVYVEGTSITTLTGPEGRYVLANVPDGEVTLVVQLLGYQTARVVVTVTSGAQITQDFQLEQEVLNLDAIVVTGTAGGTQRRAIGNVVTTIDAAEVTTVAPVATVDQLIGQRTPGLMVLPGAGQVGTGAPLRVRGVSSLSLANEPIIYIDGIRMDSNPRGGPSQRGGARVSRLNDLNPDDIASIEVIKGPAAATLYGTEASNGVIQIITKRGATGEPSLDVTARTGVNWLWNPEGRAGLLWARDPDTGELESFNLYRHERLHGIGPIFDYGFSQGYSANLSGGTEAVRYFVSTSWDDATGVVPWNWDKTFAARANLDLVLTDNMSVRTSTGYIQGKTRLAQGAINVDPFSQLRWGTPATKDQPQRGWMVAPPEEWSEVETRADNDRVTTSIEVKYQPFPWLDHRLIAGLDVNEEKDFTLYPRQPEGADHFFGNDGLGSKEVVRTSQKFLTVDYSGTADFEAGPDFALASSVGFQFYRREMTAIEATGEEFPAGPITTVSGGVVRTGSEAFEENATIGVYLQQQVGWKNRVFVTGAVRADDNSAFGAEFDAAIYPKLSATWVVHEEPFWNVEWVDQFRLRTAWGAAGKQPGTFDAARLYDPEIGYQDQPALTPSAYGNPQLKPERGEELEYGFDASLFDGRIDVVFTRYSRTIKDAIVNRPLPPSSGFDGSQIVNIGRVSGWGNELSVNARLIEGSGFAWDVGTQFATMGNRIEELGGLEFIGAGGQAQHREGYGIADIFMYKILSAQIDDEGFVTEALCDGGTGSSGLDQGGAPVPCDEAPRVRWGPSQPTWQVGVNTTVTLFGNLRLFARVDGNGGHYQANTEIRAVHNLGLSKAVLERNDPMLQAYRAIENDATGTYKAGFARLRELSATYTLPSDWAARFGAARASVSLAGRNLMMLWTAEQGWNTSRDGLVITPIADGRVWDPELRAAGQLSSGYQTIMPPMASAMLTLRLSF